MTYWRPNQMGYTTNLHNAGVYGEPVAKEAVNDDIEGNTIIINQNKVIQLNAKG